MTANLNSPLASSVTNDCQYAVSSSSTVLYLAHASHVHSMAGVPHAMACPNCPRIVRADVIDNGDSTYSASFTATRKGQYSVVTSLVNSGGVVATY
jgi:hypothetical protein